MNDPLHIADEVSVPLVFTPEELAIRYPERYQRYVAALEQGDPDLAALHLLSKGEGGVLDCLIEAIRQEEAAAEALLTTEEREQILAQERAQRAARSMATAALILGDTLDGLRARSAS